MAAARKTRVRSAANRRVAQHRMTGAYLFARQVGAARCAARDGAAVTIGVGLSAFGGPARDKGAKMIGTRHRIAGGALPPRPTMPVEFGRIDPLKADALAIAAEGVAIDNVDIATGKVDARVFANWGLKRDIGYISAGAVLFRCHRIDQPAERPDERGGDQYPDSGSAAFASLRPPRLRCFPVRRYVRCRWPPRWPLAARRVRRATRVPPR